MFIFVPFDYKKIKKTQDANTILSPFMYMNYDDACKLTCKILIKHQKHGLLTIIDTTGLTIHIVNFLEEKFKQNHKSWFCKSIEKNFNLDFKEIPKDFFKEINDIKIK